MRMYDIIEKKKHGEELSREEIFTMIGQYVSGQIPDYQISAWLMAVWFNGMSDRETFELTEAMALSGDSVDLSEFGSKSVDKHSTGGVGDKTTMIVAPIVATAGGTVAKMSGRGLGHTGGTIDKLESFPGFRTSLSPKEFTDQVRRCGLAVIGQSADLAPADKKLYALRDVTATVDSIPLIASSVMSKKLAAGSRSIVLDVKCGSGAFMRTPELAYELADTMVKIGTAHGRQTAAVITNMDIPLGHAIGNALEVCEAIEVLKGGGPDDLREVCLTLSSTMIELSLNVSSAEADALVGDALQSGRAFDKFCEWIQAQGGDVSYAKDTSRFGSAAYSTDIIADTDGYISSCNAEAIGTSAMMLGAGRQTADSVIDPRAGILLFKKPSERILCGDVIARLFTEKEQTLASASEHFRNALTFTDTPPAKQPLIYRIIRSR
ncbi:MAG: thymidine phosphorylase [Clostridia bacterium]|nr:thymidine phosphorylase [Clostridia bacterium]